MLFRGVKARVIKETSLTQSSELESLDSPLKVTLLKKKY